MKLNNTKLQLDCLLNMSKIAKFFSVEPEKNEEDPQTITIFERAYDVKIYFYEGKINIIIIVC